ncbi:hypothetical protein B0H14DRAFT_3158656 [Mycena olivaceomarginata]|nr:hypothetical protein B0H14DRAFT_3158656 [Mycena olivaceomarginata]
MTSPDTPVENSIPKIVALQLDEGQMHIFAKANPLGSPESSHDLEPHTRSSKARRIQIILFAQVNFQSWRSRPVLSRKLIPSSDFGTGGSQYSRQLAASVRKQQPTSDPPSLIASRKILRLAPWRNSPTLRPSSSTAKTITGFYDYILDRTYEFGDLLSLQIFGLSIMNACPTLRRADIGSDVSPATDIWYPGSKKKELACTLTRSPDGDVESVCATRFDFHAVGMFW